MAHSHIARLESVVKILMSLKMLFPLNVLGFNIDFSEITLENRFPPNLFFNIFVLEVF